MTKVKVRLRPIVHHINLPTVIKTAILPGESAERLFITTQLGEIFYIGDGVIKTFLNIRPRIIKLGTFEEGVASSGYDERGLLGLAFHPRFYQNGLFYLHYSVAGTQGPGALSEQFKPNPCDPKTLNLKWTNRDTQYDHIDTIEEWILQSNGQPEKRRTLLHIKRPFFNHNGVNTLIFSPETGNLVFTNGDGGSGYDPFNLSQDDLEIAGKIIEIDVSKNTFINNPPVVTRFNELPLSIQETLTVIAKGIRNITGISFQRFYNQYIKYAGNVGQDIVESIFSFAQYKPIPVTELVQMHVMRLTSNQDGFINFGWRGWEGELPTSFIRHCTENPTLDERTMAYYNETLETSVKRIQPLISYFHKDPRPDKFGGTSLTGVQPYMGTAIPNLHGSVVFTDLAKKEESRPPVKGVLAYTKASTDGKHADFHVIETDYDFGTQAAYYMSLGTNLDQTRLYLGVYGSMKVTDFNKGTIFEIIP
ncbi:PQQ-dependent sugar dehydrogenase [Bacillus tropicus]|uniref:PQQ-dependent sugar dehydrogenase n=1 Tax=Bacillus tropicus TaxID=2026188 RepID=UPI002406A8BA|nr:PQQ-dependent sugar dehydrogenase [Bacillus tropicus]MDF9556834.1 PQQ-dependent sugar dehydrogenase [Bacillus tropicus]MDF9589893.1 PQQ-dependent sugar dehydrogenase [Bacillus tropicus]MDF9649457.1 PQQ-dependent sugar dehydrogenase [Bacillus tropicus]